MKVKRMNDEIQVKGDDLKQIEQEALAREKQKEQDLKKEIEDKLKKEIAEEQAKKDKADQLKKLQEENQAMQNMLKEKETQTQQEIQKLKEQIGSTKAIHINNHPESTTKPQGLDLNELTLKEIDINSKKAFLEKYGLNEKQWSGR